MSFLERFDSEWGPKLGVRGQSMRWVFEYLLQKKPQGHLIIETGCARQDNWAGDGQSTYMFDQFAKDTLDDFTVTVEDSHCKGCVEGYPTKHFKVFDNQTNTKVNEFAFLIETENGMLKDIYRCYEYEGCKMITLGGGISNLPEIRISYELFLKERREYLNSQK